MAEMKLDAKWEMLLSLVYEKTRDACLDWLKLGGDSRVWTTYLPPYSLEITLGEHTNVGIYEGKLLIEEIHIDAWKYPPTGENLRDLLVALRREFLERDRVMDEVIIRLTR